MCSIKHSDGGTDREHAIQRVTSSDERLGRGQSVPGNVTQSVVTKATDLLWTAILGAKECVVERNRTAPPTRQGPSSERRRGGVARAGPTEGATASTSGRSVVKQSPEKKLWAKRACRTKRVRQRRRVDSVNPPGRARCEELRKIGRVGGPTRFDLRK